MRLIDADELSSKICSNNCPNCYGHCDSIDRLDIQLLIQDAPTVDTGIIQHGHWTSDQIYSEHLKISLPVQICSVCGYRKATFPLQKRPYCQMCGAKMDQIVIGAD